MNQNKELYPPDAVHPTPVVESGRVFQSTTVHILIMQTADCEAYPCRPVGHTSVVSPWSAYIEWRSPVPGS